MIERPINNLLQVLRPDDYQILAPHLKLHTQDIGGLLYKPGDNIENVYFPCGPSLVSFLVSNEDGRDVETILVGREGAVGGIVSQGRLPAYCRIVVKFPGTFARLPLTKLEDAKRQSASIQAIFSRYADCVMAQMFQSTACNAIHTIEQRTAKWILAAMDRTGDVTVPLTHEELAAMLGVGRSYTSRVLQAFKAQRILSTQRGALVIENAEALKAKSCLCNDSVKLHFDTVLKGVYPDDGPAT